MKNAPFVAVLLGIVLAVVAFLAWNQMNRLNEQISGLVGQVEELDGRLEEAEDRAGEAERRASLAEEDAEEALRSADQAETRERLSAEKAAEAETARREAEERERAAREAREEAERIADAAAAARARAEEEKAAAEKREAESILSADKAWEEVARTKAEKTRLERRMRRELDRMQGALGRIAQTRREGLELVMTLDSSSVEFDFDKADLRPENREILSRIAGVLLTFDDYGIQIFGHTDDVGSVEYNQTLSQERAERVKKYLEEAGVDPGIMTTRGLGKTSPVVEGTDPEARQRNRRVELAIVFSEGDYEALLDEDSGDSVSESGPR